MPAMTLASMSVREPHHSSREESGETREQALEQEPVRPGQPGGHVPVMVDEVLETLALKAGDVVVDATHGRGGHSKALRKAANIKLITLDADPDSGADLTANFADLSGALAGAGIDAIDKALFDLGWNRQQLQSGRGFSFGHDEPLDMSYGKHPRSGLTAADMVNTLSEEALADVLYGYGEERYARRIAAALVHRRDIAPFKTTFELVEAIRDAVPALYRHGRLNPATKTFQALRIAVNDELSVLEAGLRGAWHMLKPQGRIAVITFHSIEDRLVKRLLLELAKEGGSLVYKKPLTPSRTEVAHNPASRSAKLRAIAKV